MTAERHEETSQTTPVAMSVYSGKDIADAGVHDISTLTTIDPSVNFTTATGSGYIAIRGVSSTDLTEIGDPAVSVSRDGFFTNRSYGLFSSFYDVERVEVLKGPQGTLYGRNSSGGVINIISATPTDTFGGYVSIDAGDYQALNFEGALNLPLSDTVQMRISGVSLHHDAYRDNALATRGADDEDSRSSACNSPSSPSTRSRDWCRSSEITPTTWGMLRRSGPMRPSTRYRIQCGFRSIHNRPTGWWTPAIAVISPGACRRI